jgi:HK97 family phage prohead protease
MDRKQIRFDVKAEGETRTISGRGSVFGTVDLGGDVVLPGAFAKSIASGRKVAMLWQHDTREVIGMWTKVTEDADGLNVEGVLADTPRGNEAYALLKMGAIDGLSIGYRTLDSEWRDDVRAIKEAELWEVSVVTFPMNEEARVDAVKAAAMTEREMERKLTQDAGLSRTVARRLMDGGFEAVKGMQDAAAESEDLKELRALIAARATL